MNDAAQIITALAALIGVIVGPAMQVWLSHRAHLERTMQSIETDRKIDEVHKTTNGMKDQLVAEVRAASLAQGRKDERDERVASGEK